MTNILPRRECVGATVNRQLNRTRNMPEPKYRKRMPDKVMTVVPPDWNAEKDLDYSEDFFGDISDEEYFAAAETYVFGHNETLEKVIDAGINFYRRRLGRPDTEQHQDWPVARRLKLLEQLISAASKDPEYLSRFAEDLQVCRDVELLREQTMGKYEASPESTWLYELIDLGDWLFTAASLLDESLLCEHAEGEYKAVIYA